MLVLQSAMAVQEEGCKEKLAWWETGLDSWWEIHLVVDQGKVGAEKDSQGAPSAAQEEDSSQQVETENLLMLPDSLPAAEEGIHHH